MFGQRVEPNGFRDCLIRGGLHLTCLCAAAAPAGETHSCRILTTHDENVYAFCAHYSTRCNLFSTSDGVEIDTTWSLSFTVTLLFIAFTPIHLYFLFSHSAFLFQ